MISKREIFLKEFKKQMKMNMMNKIKKNHNIFQIIRLKNLATLEDIKEKNLPPMILNYYNTH